MIDKSKPTVGEMTFPQWQEWLVHYNALLLKRGRRIEQLEAALREIADLTKTRHHKIIADINLIARKALEGKDD
jgi:hypothetical protein